MNIINYHLELLSKINEFRNNHRLCDTRLIVDRSIIYAHKLILISSSDYFSILFSDHFSSSCDGIKDVCLTNLDGDSVHSVINYMYSGELELNDDNIGNILATADFLQIKNVIKLCEEYIITNIDSDNVILYYILIDRYPHLNISNEVFNNIQKYILDIMNSNDLKLLSEEMFIKILSSDGLGIYDEDFVVLILTKWLDITERECTVELLKCVRLSLLSIHGMKSLYTHPRICCNPECLKLCNTATFLNYNPRDSFVRCLVSVCHDTKYKQLSIESYYTHTMSWYIRNLFDTREKFSVAFLDNIIYLIGGKKMGKAISDVIGYNIDDNYWINDIPPLNTARYNTGSITHNGYIYCIGGNINESTVISDVDRWKPSNRCWKHVTNTRVPKSSMGVVSINNNIYTIGGFVKNRMRMMGRFVCTNAVESLNMNDWETHSNIPEKLASMAVSVNNGKIYTAGGFLNDKLHISDSLYSYDSVSDEWSKLTSIHIPITNSSLCSINDKLYLIGGNTMDDYNKTMRIYNIENDTWDNTDIEQNTNKRINGQYTIVFKHKCPWKTEQYTDNFLSYLETFTVR
ncbi:BTB kelch domain protein [Yokapox virus]|uniref:BTB kelch domain protein n=1 Tax=Yokapox virus TaxID=1076255 RepID=G3EI50_9POXV|nr:BTB kelch domain protein [Yokapox virus]AEN03747.1 BTB kelch domain protein [Yokapox virus]